MHLHTMLQLAGYIYEILNLFFDIIQNTHIMLVFVIYTPVLRIYYSKSTD